MVTAREHVLTPVDDLPQRTADRGSGIQVAAAGGDFLPLAGGQMTGDITLDAADTIDIGTAINFLSQLYVDQLFCKSITETGAVGFIVVVDDLEPSLDDVHDLGQVALNWDRCYATQVLTDALSFGKAAANITINTDLDPIVDDTHDLGSASLAYLNIRGVTHYINVLNVHDALQMQAAADLTANGGGTEDLGNATFYWGIGYINQLIANKVTARTGTSIAFDDDFDLSAGARDFILDTTTGTKFGTGITQKLSFWNTTPVVQPVHIANPSGGATIDAEARTAINSILADLATLGLQAAL